MHRRVAIVVVAVVCCCAALGSRPARADSATKTELPGEDARLYSCRKAHGKVSVRFKPKVELRELVTWAMGFTCRNFVFSSRIAGRRSTVTIIAPAKMSAREAYRVFLVALQSMTLTVVPKGNVLEIVEAPQAKKAAVPLYQVSRPADRDQIVRMVFRPVHLPADEVARALEALRSRHGEIKTLGSGLVLVTDYGTHIAKMIRLMRDLDRPLPREHLYLIKVRHIPVKEMAETLEQIFAEKAGAPRRSARRSVRRGRGRRSSRSSRSSRSNTGAAAGKRTETVEAPSKRTETVEAPSKIIPIERTSSLILRGTKPAYLRAKSIVDRVDVAVGTSGGRSIHVYSMRNGSAEKIAQVLNAVVSGVTQKPGGSGNRRTKRGSKTGGIPRPTVEGEVRITHDETNNALVIAASLRDYHALLQVIKRLDQPKRQVFIEAVIVEVKLGNTRTIGTTYHGGKAKDNGSVIFGGVQHKELRTAVEKPGSNLIGLNGLITGIVGKPLAGAEKLLGMSLPSFNVLFQALATVSDIEVLSTPHITTVNNVPAVISVGESIPTKTAFSTGSSTPQLVPLQNVKYQDIALELKVTPHVNASDVISLDVELNIAELSAEDLGGLGPAWTKRQIQNTVVVTDQESIVVGGLTKQKTTVTVDKVPLLGDIPVLGALFRHEHKSREKSNLLVILTPYVMKDVFDRRRITQRKMRERREFARSVAGLHQRRYLPHVDYGRKRGLVEEIHKEALRVERERKLFEEMKKTGGDVKEGRID